jgi:hypothetical protein
MPFHQGVGRYLHPIEWWHGDVFEVEADSVERISEYCCDSQDATGIIPSTSFSYYVFS